MTAHGTSQRLSIAVTHEVEDGDRLVGELKLAGVRPLIWTSVRTVAEDSEAVSAALTRIRGFSWLVFTSRRAVAAIAARTGTLPSALRVATVGRRTAAEAEAAGWQVDLVSRGPGSAALAAELAPHLKGGERVLFPVGDLASTTLEDRLRRDGAAVERVTVYRTVGCPVDGERCAAALTGDDVAGITFLSPSAARSLFSSLESIGLSAELLKTPAVAIGRETASTLRDQGFEEIHVSSTPSKRSVASRASQLIRTASPAYT